MKQFIVSFQPLSHSWAKTNVRSFDRPKISIAILGTSYFAQMEATLRLPTVHLVAQPHYSALAVHELAEPRRLGGLLPRWPTTSANCAQDVEIPGGKRDARRHGKVNVQQCRVPQGLMDVATSSTRGLRGYASHDLPCGWTKHPLTIDTWLAANIRRDAAHTFSRSTAT